MKILKSCIYVALLSILVIAESNAFDYSNQVHIKSSGEKLKSTDGGKTWNEIPVIKQDYSLQKKITSSGDIYKSSDWGRTWIKQFDKNSTLNTSFTKMMYMKYSQNENLLNIRLTANEATSSVLTIYSVDGTIIKKVNGISIQKGENSLDFQLMNVSNSKYFAILEVDSELFVGSFINVF